MSGVSEKRQGTEKKSNQTLEQTRDSVLRYGEVIGRELLNFFVRPITHLEISE